MSNRNQVSSVYMASLGSQLKAMWVWKGIWPLYLSKTWSSAAPCLILRQRSHLVWKLTTTHDMHTELLCSLLCCNNTQKSNSVATCICKECVCVFWSASMHMAVCRGDRGGCGHFVLPSRKLLCSTYCNYEGELFATSCLNTKVHWDSTSNIP